VRRAAWFASTFVAVVLPFAAVPAQSAVSSASPAPAPCSGVDRSLSADRKTALAPIVAKQLKVPTVDVLQSFAFGGWSVIGVATHQSDDAYLFYARDPADSTYVTLWSGAAAPGEQSDIRTWVLTHAKGVPPALATCFSRYVTHD